MTGASNGLLDPVYVPGAQEKFAEALSMQQLVAACLLVLTLVWLSGCSRPEGNITEKSPEAQIEIPDWRR
jgi:hypothetical protein